MNTLVLEREDILLLKDLLSEGMKIYIWDMKYLEDKKFTREVLIQIKAFAKSLGITNFLIEIWEKYKRKEKVPHYHILVSFGVCPTDSSAEACLSVSYDATAHNETFNGTMKIRFRSRAGKNNRIAVSNAFGFYNSALDVNYPDWTTEYKEIRLGFKQGIK